jgi:hypothetical protein
MRVLSIKLLFVLFTAGWACQGFGAAIDWDLRDLPTIVDPDGDCKCAVHKGAAEISVPKYHDLSAEMDCMNAPRALCEVVGDFSVRVKTDCVLSPRNPGAGGRSVAYQGASLVVMADDANYLRLDRAAFYHDGALQNYANFEVRRDSKLEIETPADLSIMNGFGIPDAHVRYLRMDRAGDKVAGYVSGDGVKWLYLGWKTLKLPAKVKAGVAVVNTAQEPLKVRFSEFGTARIDVAKPVAVKPLDKQQQEKLLTTRLHGGIDSVFDRCSRLFLLSSRMEMPCGVAMMTSSEAIARTKLHPVFPAFYRPTLREYLDAVALQASSEWRYDPTSKFFKNDIESGPPDDLAIFEFKETKRAKPFEMTLPKGWKAAGHGDRTIYTTPDLPAGLGLQILQLGGYSADDEKQEKALLKKAVNELSMEWANRFKPVAQPMDLKEAKVGPYAALQFETAFTLQNGNEIRERQWVFSVENKCFLAFSAIPAEGEEKIEADVRTMLKSLRAAKAEGGPSDD